MERNGRKSVDRIKEYCHEADRKHRWALLRQGAVVLAGVGAIGLLLWSAGKAFFNPKSPI